MKDSISDKMEGAAHELKGAVKQTLGIATNSPELEAEGAEREVAVGTAWSKPQK